MCSLQSMLGEVGQDVTLLLHQALRSISARSCASKKLSPGSLLFEDFAEAVTWMFYNQSLSATKKVCFFFFLVTETLLLDAVIFLSLHKLLPCFSLSMFLSLCLSQSLSMLQTHLMIPVVSNAHFVVVFAPQRACHLDWGSWIISLRTPKVFCHSEENVLAAKFRKCDLRLHISWICHPLCFITVLFLHGGRCRYQSFKTHPDVLFICHFMSGRLTNWDVLVRILNLENDTIIFFVFRVFFKVSFQSHRRDQQSEHTRAHVPLFLVNCDLSQSGSRVYQPGYHFPNWKKKIWIPSFKLHCQLASTQYVWHWLTARP